MKFERESKFKARKSEKLLQRKIIDEAQMSLDQERAVK